MARLALPDLITLLLLELPTERGTAVITSACTGGCNGFRHAAGGPVVDETYLALARGRDTCTGRSTSRDRSSASRCPNPGTPPAAHRFITRALRHVPVPVQVTTTRPGRYLRVLEGLVPTAAP